MRELRHAFGDLKRSPAFVCSRLRSMRMVAVFKSTAPMRGRIFRHGACQCRTRGRRLGIAAGRRAFRATPHLLSGQAHHLDVRNLWWADRRGDVPGDWLDRQGALKPTMEDAVRMTHRRRGQRPAPRATASQRSCMPFADLRRSKARQQRRPEIRDLLLGKLAMTFRCLWRKIGVAAEPTAEIVGQRDPLRGQVRAATGRLQ